MINFMKGIERYKDKYRMTNSEYQNFLNRINILLGGYITHPSHAILTAITEMKQKRKQIKLVKD